MASGPSWRSSCQAIGYVTQMSDAAEAPAEGLTLLLFTESYPYDIALEGTFLGPQLPHLQEIFANILLIPARRGGSRWPVPDGIEVEESLSILLAHNSTPLILIARAGISPLFRRELAERPFVLKSLRALKRLARMSAQAALTRDWVERLFARRRLRPERCVAYTFWCDQATTGLGLVKDHSPDLVVVSRANGIDLYEERHSPPFLPCRSFTLARLDRLFPVSEHGLDYVAERYPWFAPRCEVARLGVADPHFIAAPTSPERCVLVSCSGVVPIKRVDLIARGIERAARLRPNIAFDWHHFGDGDLRAEIAQWTIANFPANAKAQFHGHQSIDEIMRFYRSEPVDAFVNASISEGGSPVAIMEAAACGIPIIATAVGGNPEIVSSRNGWLVGPDPSPREIADAVTSLIDHPEATATKRLESRRVWEQDFQASANYSSFARRLAELRIADQ